MGKQSVERIKEILSEAKEIKAGSARAEFLKQACGSETQLRTEVESLLAASDSTCDFLSRDASGEVLQDSPDLIGTMIDHYRLIELVGVGGFGNVYRAEQIEPLHREVALKIIKLGMDTKQVVARFEAERQALARMNHPGIAQVYDAGTTESGRPYFVMELVHGLPIIKYCDRHRLSMPDRIELFQQVCDAVQHAHQKGILHRDLKPSNILVSDENGKSLTKIIDFGIAKSLEGRLTAKTLVTLQEMLIGTPMYMSPEQLSQIPSAIDTRSDIYSLGVILYELVAGTTPLEHKTPTSLTMAGMRQSLANEEPPRPSRRFHALGKRTAVIADRRQIKPPTLERLLRGDLDWVVMKAIEKERDRRYDDVIALSEDLVHYLKHERVSAGPPRLSRRFCKFVRRHHTVALVMGSVGISLLIGAGVTAIGIFHQIEQNLKGSPVQITRGTPVILPGTPDDTHFVDVNNPNAVPPYLSWETAANTITQALETAAPGDTVLINDGTYSIQNTLTLIKAITLQSRNGPEHTILDAGQRCRILRLPTSSGPRSIRGLTLTGGYSYGGTGMWISGNEPVTVEDCIITGNRSVGGGAGGIAIFTKGTESPDVTIRNCIITNNQSTIEGCGIRVHAPRSETGTVHIVDCLVADNITESDGGGISCLSSKTRIILSNCTVENNEAHGFGGGIQIYGKPTDKSQVVIRGCTVLNNRAGRRGGGINATMQKKCESTYLIEDCLVSGNTSLETGGGIRCFSYDGSVRVTRCRVSHNSSGQAGGVMLGTETVITDSLIYGNEAVSGTGGGIRRGPPGGGTVINCTIVGNSSSEEGGGTHIPHIINSIVYGNTAPQYPDIMPETKVQFSCSTSLTNGIAGNITADPQFTNPEEGNFQLLENSPCIDAGTTRATSLGLDLAGNPRVVDRRGDGKAVVDMGAFEFQQPEEQPSPQLPPGDSADIRIQFLGMTVVNPSEELVRKYGPPKSALPGPVITELTGEAPAHWKHAPHEGCSFSIVENPAHGFMFNEEKSPRHHPYTVRQLVEAIVACTVTPEEYQKIRDEMHKRCRKQAELLKDEPDKRDRLLRIVKLEMPEEDRGMYICRVVYNYPNQRGTMTTFLRMAEPDFNRLCRLLQE